MPLRTVFAAAALSVLCWQSISRPAVAAADQPDLVAALGRGSHAYINPIWMLRTLVLFPMLAALWFLLLVPGAGTLGVHWRLLQPATLVVAVLGLWCAAAGTAS